MLLAGSLLFSLTATASEVITFDPPPGIKPSRAYEIRVNGREVFVYDSPIVSYAVFDFTGTAEVTIRANRDVKWVDVRPVSMNIKPIFRDSTIRFTLDEPCNLSIELNGEFSNRPLFLFSNSPEEDRPDRDDPDVIWFEGGKMHEPGLIEVGSGQTVYIEGGAVVHGIIHAKNASKIRVCGRGILDGSDNSRLRRESGTRFVEFQDCRKIQIEDIILEDSHTWQIVPIHCNRVTIRNVRIISDNGSDDGIDIVRSRNVEVSHCFIRTRDDCIAVKTAWDYPGSEGAENIDVHDCVFWNGAWGNGLEIGFELRSDYVRKVTFRDCDMIHVEDGAVLSIHNGDVSTVEKILFEDIRVEDARQKLIDLDIFYGRYSLDRPDDPEERDRRYLHGAWDGVLYLTPRERKEHAGNRGHIRDVTFRNIQVVDGIFPFSIIYGWDRDHQVEDIVIEDLIVHGKKITSLGDAKLYIENARNIEIK